MITPALFLATKLEAFKDRGRGDYYGSHDLEDIVALVDGRSSIASDVRAATEPVRTFIHDSFVQLLAHPDFQDAFPGRLPVLSRPRVQQVLQRFQSIAAG